MKSSKRTFHKGDMITVEEFGTFTKIGRLLWIDEYNEIMLWELEKQDIPYKVKLWHPEFTTDEGYIVVFIGEELK